LSDGALRPGCRIQSGRPVILSEAKDLAFQHRAVLKGEILRFAQDDRPAEISRMQRETRSVL
jgi:hypothetical protein